MDVERRNYETTIADLNNKLKGMSEEIQKLNGLLKNRLQQLLDW